MQKVSLCDAWFSLHAHLRIGTLHRIPTKYAMAKIGGWLAVSPHLQSTWRIDPVKLYFQPQYRNGFTIAAAVHMLQEPKDWLRHLYLDTPKRNELTADLSQKNKIDTSINVLDEGLWMYYLRSIQDYCVAEGILRLKAIYQRVFNQNPDIRRPLHVTARQKRKCS